MTLQKNLLNNTIQLTPHQHILFLNSAADPFVSTAAQHITTGTITLAEDNIASLRQAQQQTSPSHNLRHIPFHEYVSKEPPATIDIAIINLLYQPAKTWTLYGLQVAAYALKPGGQLYVVGAKDRGILSIAKHMQEIFGNVETLLISKGHRVVSSRKIDHTPNDSTAEKILSQNRTHFPQILSRANPSLSTEDNPNNSQDEIFLSQNRTHFPQILSHAANAPAGSSLLDTLYGPSVFAQGKLDEGTRLLIEALQVQPADEALDIGCGAGYLGLHIARQANRGHVTMVDASLATVALAQRNITESGLPNIDVLPSDGAQAVLSQRFDLVVTNPPFHQGGIQTTEIAERFIREATRVLRPQGRFYLVANRFLKYEPTLKAHFNNVTEVGGNTRFKVLLALRV
ncbi:MAG: 16S rRNA methyltransferase [Chloroflexi bacterium]|nr:MAG: 16S rRNA methyltransferase [Chloroflexota bacterium]